MAGISDAPHRADSREVRGKHAALSAYVIGLREDIAAEERERADAGTVRTSGTAWWAAVAAQAERRRQREGRARA